MPVITPVDIEPVLFRDLGNNSEPWVVAQIARAQEVVEGALGRKIEVEAGITETLDGFWTHSILLSHWPVIEITSVVENDVTLAPADFAWTSDGVLRRLTSAGWPMNWVWKPAGIVVTYEAGFEPGTVGFADLAGVVLRVATRHFQAAAADAELPDGVDGIASEQLGDYQATYRKDPTELNRTESVVDAMYLTDDDLVVINRYRTPVLV